MPAMIFINVDLPAPFSPISAWTWPRLRRNETSSSASTPGKALRTFSTSSRYSEPGTAPLARTICAVDGLNVAMALDSMGDGRLPLLKACYRPLARDHASARSHRVKAAMRPVLALYLAAAGQTQRVRQRRKEAKLPYQFFFSKLLILAGVTSWKGI